MNLNEIKFLLDLKSISEVNNYIEKGWILIDNYTVAHDPEFAKNHLTMHYIIGATSDIDYSKELQYQNKFSDLEF